MEGQWCRRPYLLGAVWLTWWVTCHKKLLETLCKPRWFLPSGPLRSIFRRLPSSASAWRLMLKNHSKMAQTWKPKRAKIESLYRFSFFIIFLIFAIIYCIYFFKFFWFPILVLLLDQRVCQLPALVFIFFPVSALLAWGPVCMQLCYCNENHIFLICTSPLKGCILLLFISVDNACEMVKRLSEATSPFTSTYQIRPRRKAKPIGSTAWTCSVISRGGKLNPNPLRNPKLTH